MTKRELDQNTRSTKRERIDVRIAPEQKARVQRAADLEGRSLTDFVTSSIQRAAEEVIRTHEILTLSARDSQQFVETLLNPPAPTARQRAAAVRYLREFGED